MYIKNPIVQKIYKCQKSRTGKTIFNKKPIGIMIAGLDYRNTNNVCIGYSLCHKKDKFDYVEVDGVVIHSPDFGKRLATRRAIDWADKRWLEVPPSIYKNVVKFTDRCRKYYQGARLPMWTFLPVESTIIFEVEEVETEVDEHETVLKTWADPVTIPVETDDGVIEVAVNEGC